MKGKTARSRKAAQVSLQVFFLALFAFLWWKGKLQLWMFLFGGALVASPFLGRFYCGWMCPMHTGFSLTGWLRKKLGLRWEPTPRAKGWKWVRSLVALAFLALLVIIRVQKIPFNAFGWITVAGLLFSLLLGENLWHRVFCPFGTFLRVFSRRGFFSARVLPEACVGCGACQKVCPSSAIKGQGLEKRQVTANECLVCTRCQDVCPTNAIVMTPKGGKE